MKSKLLMFIATLIASVASAGLQAQTEIPYLPMNSDFGGNAVDPATFLIPSGDYTLEMEGTSGTEISVAGGVIKYTPTTTGTIRFAHKSGKIYVYEGTIYMTTLLPQADATSGITGANTPVCLEGDAYAPKMFLSNGDYFNFTSTITNPSFEVGGVNGWTNNGFAAQSNNPGTFVKNGNIYIEKYINSPGTLANSDIHQVLDVPNGTYILTASAHARANQNAAGTTYIEGAILYANEQNTVVSEGKDYDVRVTVVDGTLKVGFKLESSPANWVGADNFRLKYLGIDSDLNVMLASLQTLVTNASHLSGTKMQNTVATALTTAISAAQTVIDNPTSATEVSIINAATALTAATNAATTSATAYADLNTAIATANANKSLYSTFSGYAAFETTITAATGIHTAADADVATVNQTIADLKAAERTCRFTESTPADYTWLITNPGFETYSGDKDQNITGWTKTGPANSEYCIRTDAGPAGKTGTGYVQYWSNANPKPDYSLSQTFSGVPNGKYKVTAFAGGDANTKGTYVYANSDQKEVTANGDHEVTTLVSNNSLTVGFKSVNRTVNWSYADNFRLQYLGVDLTDFENRLNEQLTIAAEAQYDVEANYFNAQHYTDFQNARTIAQRVYDDAAHTVDDLIGSTSALQDAIAIANSSITAQARKTIILEASNSDITTVLANPKFDEGTTGWTTNMGIFSGNNTKWSGWEEGYNPAPSINNVLDRGATGVSYGYQTLPFMPAGYYIAKAVIRGQTLTPSNLYLFINNGTDYLNADGTVEKTVTADRIGDTNGPLTLGFGRYTTTGITISEGENITLGIRVDNEDASRWQSADAFELHYYANEITFLSIEKSELLATANAIIAEDGKMAATVKTALSNAINVNWDNLSTEDFRTALSTLKSAITAANASIAEYVTLDDFLNSVESALDSYSSYSGYPVYTSTVTDARTAYTNGTTIDVQTAILNLKMAKNICIFSDGAIHDNPNLLYGWDANQDGRTPEAAGWIASQHDIIWGGKLTGPNDNLDALYRSDAIAPNYAFYAKATKNNTVITYAYPVYLEAGKHYFFKGKNWRRNGQYAADAANVTFAISSTASKTGTILAEQTVFCDIANYVDYSFAFNVTSTGVYYLIRYAGEGSTNLQDASTALSLVETYSLIDGKATVTGELTEALKTELASTGITSVNLTNATAASNMELTFNNPNTVVYGVPENVTLANGIAEGSTAKLDENYPFHAPLGLTANVSYERAAFTETSNDSGENGWQSIVLPFDVTSITSVDGNGTPITLVPFGSYVEASDDRPFWLYKVESGSYVAASSIEANTTYLISFPNDPSYNAVFNTNGAVTFHGTAIAATEGLNAQPVTNAYTLNPNFDGLKNNVYAINATGSMWEKNSSVNSFYGYVTDPVAAGAPQFLPIFDFTGIKKITAKAINDKKTTIVTADNGVIIESKEAGNITIYSTSGQQIATVELQEGSNFVTLAAGEYIINGVIAIVK